MRGQATCRKRKGYHRGHAGCREPGAGRSPHRSMRREVRRTRRQRETRKETRCAAACQIIDTPGGRADRADVRYVYTFVKLPVLECASEKETYGDKDSVTDGLWPDAGPPRRPGATLPCSATRLYPHRKMRLGAPP